MKLNIARSWLNTPRVVVGLLSVFTAAWLTPPGIGAEPAAKPSLCFVTGVDPDDLALLGELRKGGMQIDCAGIHELSAERMQQYSALVFPEFPLTDPLLKSNNSWQVQPEYLEAFDAAIDDYVQNGGGVVVYGVCFFQTQLRGMQAMNGMMKPWGVETLYEQVWDPERQFHYRRLFPCDYSWTGRLEKHPLTDGLKWIYYVSSGVHGPGTCTFKLSKEWTPLVRGENSSSSVLGGSVEGKGDFFIEKKGTYDSSPPIVAVREYGKGRMAVIGVTPTMAFFGARWPHYGDVLLSAGDGDRLSDYGKLQERIYRWVAEPAMKTGHPGGYEAKTVAANINPDLVAPSVDWSNFRPREGSGTFFRGLIGARTKDGGGSGTVCDYVKAAEAAGLRFVAFTEDFSLLDAAKWEAFKKTCREASTAQVAAIPGFLYRDNVNARWITVGEFAFPPRPRLSPDGKRIIDPFFWLEVGTSDNPLNAPIDVGHNPRPFWTYSLYTAMAVKTFENGKLIDDATDAYRDRQDIEDFLTPITVDLIDSPSKVSIAAAHCTGVMVPDQEELRRVFTCNRIAGQYFFASSGPFIADWSFANLTRATQGQWEPRPGTERFAVSFTAVSAVGLRGVRLLDGPHLLRRFDAGGAKEFTQTVHLLHDRQRHLVVEAEDVQGQTAITGQPGFGTCDQLNVRRMMADRCNGYSISVMQTEKGRVFIADPVTHFQRKTTSLSFHPGFSDLPIKFNAPYGDGAIRPVEHSCQIKIPFKNEKTRDGQFAAKMVHPMSSRDVIIQQSDLIGWYTNVNASAWKPCETVLELRDFTASVRWLDFVKRYHDPGLTQVEVSIDFLRDGELDSGQAPNPVLDRILTPSTDLNVPAFSIAGGLPGGLSGLTSKENPPRFDGPIAKGGYLALFPNPMGGAGAIFALEPGAYLSAILERPTPAVSFGLAMGGTRVKKGQQIRYRFLVGRGVLGAEPSDREWREFGSTMGLVGKPAYAPEATQGKILSTNYVLEGEAVDGGFAVTIQRAQLPVRLPICVHPVNPKWSAVVCNVANGSFLPVGVIEKEQKAYATWEAGHEKVEVYVGNIVMCDSPDLVLTAVCAGLRWSIEVHNPTKKAVKTGLKGAVKFKPLAGLVRTVEVPPGQSVMVEFPEAK